MDVTGSPHLPGIPMTAILRVLHCQLTPLPGDQGASLPNHQGTKGPVDSTIRGPGQDQHMITINDIIALYYY